MMRLREAAGMRGEPCSAINRSSTLRFLQPWPQSIRLFKTDIPKQDCRHLAEYLLHMAQPIRLDSNAAHAGFSELCFTMGAKRLNSGKGGES